MIPGYKLRTYVKNHGFCDITSLLPEWISCHGWVHGLNTIKMSALDARDENWIQSIFFDDNLLVEPRKKIPKKVIDSWMLNQFKQRSLTLKLLGSNMSDTFQQLQVLSNSDSVTPYKNDYDLMIGYETYIRLWSQYQRKWDQQQRIKPSLVKPIVNQLAYPPRALRWHSSLDRTDYLARDKWD